MSYGYLPPAEFTAYYHLQADGTDASGNGRTMSTSGGISFTTGKFGNGLSTSSSGYALYSTASSIGVSASVVTVSLWLKYSSDSSSSNACRMFQLYDAVHKIYYGLEYYINGGPALSWERGDITSFTDVGSITYTLPTTTWNLYTLTYDSSNIRGYINGSLMVTKSSTSSGQSTSYNSSIALGGYVNLDNPNRNFVYGIYNEFIVDSICWTPAQIKRYYDMTLGRMAPQVIV